MASLTLKNVCKRYDNGFVAVKDFSLDVDDREFIIFVGPSGCGKSTTLRMIAGLEDISDGDLLIDGKRVNDVEPKDRDIAMVFQNYALYPHMTVYDNMAFGLKLRKTPKAEIDKLVQEYEYKIIAIKNENEEKIKEYQILLEEVKKTALDNKYNSNPCCHCHQGEQEMRGEDSFRKKKLSINNNQHSRTINITNRSNYNNNYTMENTSMYKADLTEIDEHIKALKKKIGGL
jgi:ABC-type dipeptide/oligopeptide/nickel transport system ATPase component